MVRVLIQGLKVVTIAMATILAISGSIWFFDYWQDRELAGERGRPVVVQITEEDDSSSVAGKLTDSELVTFGIYFEARMRFSEVELRPGIYTLRTGMSVPDIIDAITMEAALGDDEETADTVAEPIEVTFIEGQRAEEFAATLEAAGMPNGAQEFMDALDDPDIRASFDFLDGIPEGASINGFLFPDTYTIPADSTGADVVYYMLETFDQRVTPEMRQQFEAQGLSLYEAVTVASIVEREAAVAEERPIIAAAYLNRLEQDPVMHLNADPTIQYAVGTPNEWWPAPLTDENLALDSPYNTYIYRGLPPSPISNPGLASLQAVGEPAEVDYLYFVAKQDGSGEHVFTNNLAEHEQNLCRYLDVCG